VYIDNSSRAPKETRYVIDAKKNTLPKAVISRMLSVETVKRKAYCSCMHEHAIPTTSSTMQ